MPPDFLTLNPNDSQARFIAGEVAILQRPSAMINVLNADAKWKFGTNWDIANFPKAKATRPRGRRRLHCRTRAGGRGQKAAAHAFAKYLTGPDIGPDLKKQTPPVEYWLAPAGRKTRWYLRRLPPSKSEGGHDGRLHLRATEREHLVGDRPEVPAAGA